jgi:3-hydroxyisobutyrate dehydrogenase-like beta-hydroxyacid dehydrogenase
MPEMRPIGLVGIGLMGEAFAQRLIGAGLGVCPSPNTILTPGRYSSH